MPINAVTQYSKDVTSGKIVAGEPVRLACKRHLDDLKHALKRGFYFDETEADLAIQLSTIKCHSKGKWAGTPIELSDWQKFIKGSLFGWKRLSTGLRRFRMFYGEVSRKNGKSTMMADLGIDLAFLDGEGGAEVYTAATKRDQARIVFDAAREMVRASPDLKSAINIFNTNMHMTSTASKMEPLSADSRTLDGLNVHAGIIDEFHEHKTSGVLDILDTATGSRSQSLICVITTAGASTQSPCFLQRKYCIDMLKGMFEDDSLFAYIATIDEGDDWKDEDVWIKANPNLGVSVNIEDLRRKCAKAKNMTSARRAFQRYHLNVWTEAQEAWLDLVAWDQSGSDFDDELLQGRPCYVGVDLSTKIDLSAMAFVFPPTAEDSKWRVKVNLYMPENRVTNRDEGDRVPYDEWIEQGYITATPGDIIDFDYIQEDAEKCMKKYSVIDVGFDPYAATQFATNMVNAGFNMIEVRQGHLSLSEPTKELEAQVISRNFDHGNNPVLRWMASNVVVRLDQNNNYIPDKKKSSCRIDGIAAIVNGMARALSTDDNGPSVYEERGFRSL